MSKQENRFICPTCGEKFSTNGNLIRHINSEHDKVKYTCDRCQLVFNRPDHLKQHQKKAETLLEFKCQHCPCFSANKGYKLTNHIKKVHKSILEGAGNHPTDASSERMDIPTDNETMEDDTQYDDVITSNHKTIGKRVNFLNPVEPKKKRLDEDVVVVESTPSEIESDQNAATRISPPAPDENVATSASSPVPPFQGNDDDDHQSGQDLMADLQNEVLADENNGVGLNSPDYYPLTGAVEDNVSEGVPSQCFRKLLTEDYFALKIWRVTCDKQRVFEPEMNNAVILEQLLSFIKGTELDLKGNFLWLLSSDVTNYFGTFLIGLMLTTHIATLLADDALQLLHRKAKFPTKYHALIEKMVTFQLLRISGFSAFKVDKVLNSPDPQKALASLCQTRPKNPIQNKADTSAVLNEMKLQFKDLICENLYENSSTILDDSFSAAERKIKWNLILNVFFEKLVATQEARINLLEKILDASEELESQVYFALHDGEMKIPVRLTPAAVEAKGSGKPDPSATVFATEHDLVTLKKLLYTTGNDMTFRKGRITFGLYQLADQLQITEIWSFLFADSNVKEASTESTRVDILKILIDLDKDDMLEVMAKRLGSCIPLRDLYTCMNGLPADKVVKFLDRDAINLNEVCVLKIMITWACHKLGKPYNFEKSDDETLQKFKEIGSALRLTCIPTTLTDLTRCAYITDEDIYDAEAVLEGEKSQKDVWFSTKGPRCLT